MGRMLRKGADGNVDETLLEAFERQLGADLPSEASFGRFEEEALNLSNELVRRSLEKKLEQMAAKQPAKLSVKGVLYQRHQNGHGSYPSLCGPLIVRRWTYRQVGVRNGPTVVPLEYEAGLVEGATPQLGRCVALGYAKAPIRSVEQDLRAAHRRPPSRCTLERMAKEIGTQAKKVALRIEDGLRSQETVPETAVAINLGLDRTSIPMAEDEARSGEIRRVLRFRMGYVGTVTFTDVDGNSLVTRRYAIPAHVTPTFILKRMMADLRRARSCKPGLRIAVVQDGAPELWTLMQDALRTELKLGPCAIGWYELIDRYHLMEHLSKGLELLLPNSLARERKLNQWREALDRSNLAIKKIRRWFDRVAIRKKCWTKMLSIVGRYICIYRRFRYRSALRLGLHQGSGVTEGACKTLITKRTKRSGQRWRPRGIGAVLALRTIVESNRFDGFWPLFARRYHSLPLAA